MSEQSFEIQAVTSPEALLSRAREAHEPGVANVLSAMAPWLPSAIATSYRCTAGIVAALDRLTEAVERLGSRSEPVTQEAAPHLRKVLETRFRALLSVR